MDNNPNPNSVENKNNQKSDNKTLKLIIIIGAVILIVLLLIVFLFIKSQSKNSNETESSGGGLALEINQGGFVEEATTTEAVPGVTIPGWATLEAKAGETDTKISFYNPEQNAGWYYLTFELRLMKDDGSYETLYQSGLVEPGNYVQNIKLNRALDKGEYDVIIFCQPYTMKSAMPEKVNNLESKAVLVVS